MFVIANPDGEDDAAEVDTIQAAAVRAGRPADRIAGRDIPGLNPSRRMPAFTALHLPDEASLDAAVLHAALGAALRAHPGVRVVDGGVERIELDGVGVKARLDAGASVDAARAVLAGGVGTSRVLAASSMDLGVSTAGFRSGRQPARALHRHVPDRRPDAESRFRMWPPRRPPCGRGALHRSDEPVVDTPG